MKYKCSVCQRYVPTNTVTNTDGDFDVDGNVQDFGNCPVHGFIRVYQE